MATAKKAGGSKGARRARLPGRLLAEKMNGFPVMRVKAGKLKGADYNPRAIDAKALAGLESSVQEFGLPQPIIWNRRTGKVVGGHQRLKTLDSKADTDVVVVDLEEAKEKALNVALNSRHIEGDWTSGLAEVLEDIQASSDVGDLFDDLRLGELKLDIPVADTDVEWNGSGTEEGGAPNEVTEDVSFTAKKHECPNCGHRFSAKKK